MKKRSKKQRHPGGRPARAGEQSLHRVSPRLTTDEFAYALTLATREGKSLSDLAREGLLRGYRETK